MIKKILHTIKHLNRTVHADYGKGPLNYLKFLYYSCFRINTFYVYVADLRGDLQSYSPINNYHFHQPTLKELENLRQDIELPRDFYFDKIHGLDTCYVATKDSELAYIHWIYKSSCNSRFFKLSDGFVEINNCVTLSCHRGQKIMSAMLNYTNIELMKLGYHHSVAAVHSNNIASIKSFDKSGFVKLYEIKTVGPLNSKIDISKLIGQNYNVK